MTCGTPTKKHIYLVKCILFLRHRNRKNKWLLDIFNGVCGTKYNLKRFETPYADL